MTITTNYAYSPEQVTQAFTEISTTLFANKTAHTTPRMLITAGVQASGKTYLLEKSLLLSRSYDGYVRLYQPEYREKHPQYAEMIKHGALHAYEHTEAFVREVCGKIFEEAFQRKLDIIMECAFDSIGFAALPSAAAAKGYQLEVHVVACSHAFAFISNVKRALKSLEKQELERFVRSSELKSSMNNSHAVLTQFEAAANTVEGSQIFLYERGLGELKERTLRGHSTCVRNSAGNLELTSTDQPYAYGTYERIVSDSINSLAERDEMIRECHLALMKTGQFADQVPDFVYNALYARIVKYVNR
ncbi:zeta toxin family protein [Pseudomonas sp. NPDC087346]|uniref:zeta toxin family protein n=1 Tax=Pseudomonas sp. NPDC087346 TaxID=3364438 RepID=UPI0037F1CF3B